MLQVRRSWTPSWIDGRERTMELRRVVDGARTLRPPQQQVQAVARRDAVAWALERRAQPESVLARTCDSTTLCVLMVCCMVLLTEVRAT